MSQTINNLQINGSNPVTVGGTGVGIKYFPFVPGASIGVASTKNGILAIPGSNRANGQKLKVVATGDASLDETSGSPTLTIALYSATYAAGAWTIGSALATSGTISPALTNTPLPWSFVVDLFGTTASGIVNGSFRSIVDNTLNSSSVVGLTNNLSGINFASEPPFGVVMGVTFSVSEAKNTANMYQFEIQQ
jgi:hypothetical protein